MILLIDATSKKIKLALDDKAVGVESIRQTTDLPKIAKEFLMDAKPDAIGVVTGPGSFTGIRLGIAYAKGLAMGFDIPLIGINLFELAKPSSPLWRGAPKGRGGLLAVKSDRGDYYTFDGKEYGISPDLPENAKLVTDWDPKQGVALIREKLKEPPTPTIPLYIRPSYVDNNC
ncbi:MAG: hypothetical protein LBQ49_02600 [Rickettsiales bacterium]|jgi:tRNA A37 threonylcarbamoyladenosine modification protein TsaB|nr:hypothetical protein [Rickettsiales bacterium]